MEAALARRHAQAVMLSLPGWLKVLALFAKMALSHSNYQTLWKFLTCILIGCVCRFVVMNLFNLAGAPNLSPPFTPSSMSATAKVRQLPYSMCIHQVLYHTALCCCLPRSLCSRMQLLWCTNSIRHSRQVFWGCYSCSAPTTTFHLSVHCPPQMTILSHAVVFGQ